MSRTPYQNGNGQRGQPQSQRSDLLRQSDFELFDGMNSQISRPSRSSTNGAQNGAQNGSRNGTQNGTQQVDECTARCRSRQFSSTQEMQDCFVRCAALRPQAAPNGARTAAAQNGPGRVGVAGTANGAPVQAVQQPARTRAVPIVNPNAPGISTPAQTPQGSSTVDTPSAIASAASLSNYVSRLQFPTNIDWDCVKNCDERARRNEFDTLDALLICLDPCNPQPGSPLVPDLNKTQPAPAPGSANTCLDVVRQGIQRACSNAYRNNLNDYNNCVSDASNFVDPLIKGLTSQPTQATPQTQARQNGGMNGMQNGVQAVPTRASANGLKNGGMNGANDPLNMAAQRGCAEGFPNDQNSYNTCVAAVQNAFRYANCPASNPPTQGSLNGNRNGVKFLSPTQVSNELARSQNPPTVSTSEYQSKVDECLAAGLPINQCDHYAFLPTFDIQIETRPGSITTTVTPVVPNNSPNGPTNSNGNVPPCRNCPPSQNGSVVN
jgi:hypothetical protein